MLVAACTRRVLGWCCLLLACAGLVAGEAGPPQDVTDRLAAQLPEAAQRAIVARIRAEFPGANLVDTEQLYGLLLQKRQQRGHRMTMEVAAEHATWVQDAEAVHRSLVELRATELGLALHGRQGEQGFSLVGFAGDKPMYSYTQNETAAIATGANLVRQNSSFDPAVGGSVSGDGLYVNVNDSATIGEHPEFQLPGGGSRIVYKETNSTVDDHMTHVTGTVAAWGYNSSLIGMAPRVWIRSHIQPSTGDITQHGMMTPGQLHSVNNPRTGQPEMKSVLGTSSLGYSSNTRYTTSSAAFDSTLWDYPYFTMLFAACNYGSAYETIGMHWTMPKNVLTIGSTLNIVRDGSGNYVSGGDARGASARGPTYDGRIKPDFMTDGSDTLSTSLDGTTATKSGTSMATPAVAGSLVLLIDYVRQRMPGQYLRSATYKALLMNTSDDLGNAGPDYTYGWGAINVYAAGLALRGHAEQPSQKRVIEDQLAASQTWSQSYVSDGSPLRISLAWLDPAGTAQATTDTDRAPRLVNDLDLRLIGPGGVEYRPFVMPYATGDGTTAAFSTSLYAALATTGDNDVDPCEQIRIAAPAAGAYTLQITHEGSLKNNAAQQFSLVVSGLGVASPTTPTVATAASATPNPVTGTTTALSVLGADDGGESALTYTWATTGTPPATVSFSVNGTNAAKSTVATFSKAGSYSFQVTIRDSSNATVTSSVSVTVNQTLTTIAVTPATVTLANSGTQAFGASAKDQFGTVLATQPAFTWSLASGIGSVSAGGVYTAPASGTGSGTVRAASGAVSGNAVVTVTNAAPTVATAAAATPSPVTGTTATLSALGADDGGEAALTYTWATTGIPPAAVSFSVNGTNAAKTTTATFSKAGSYSF
ncbi:MAG TPA: hypothetical protein DCS97_06285, partial [Planctomycetes bacterium]|nr:hypothetical protein [Planctomycetota bacterium]